MHSVCTHLLPDLACCVAHVLSVQFVCPAFICNHPSLDRLCFVGMHTIEPAVRARCPLSMAACGPVVDMMKCRAVLSDAHTAARAGGRPELEATVQARLDSMAGRRVGYLKLKSFTARTQPDVAAAVRHLQVRKP